MEVKNNKMFDCHLIQEIDKFASLIFNIRIFL